MQKTTKAGRSRHSSTSTSKLQIGAGLTGTADKKIEYHGEPVFVIWKLFLDHYFLSIQLVLLLQYMETGPPEQMHTFDFCYGHSFSCPK